MNQQPILTINSGSSSLKLGIFVQNDGDECAIGKALVDGIGKGDAKLELRDGSGQTVLSEGVGRIAPSTVLKHLAVRLRAEMKIEPVAIGHRIVHGGPALITHQEVTSALLADLRQSLHFAPLHIPAALALIEAAREVYPSLPQYACFDTAFHRMLPEAASRFALPSELFREGIRRYGFHGLSYESILHALGSQRPDRIVVAHLGNGASLAAIAKGTSVDTTMGLTPTGGIPMGTRTGDLDPGVLLYLLRNKHMTAEGLEDLLNHGSGLLALSKKTSDMRELESLAGQGDDAAQLAIDVFALSIQKTIAGYAAVLGGLDLLVFTGGIGEHSALLRSSVCNQLGFLGIQLDAQSNEGNAEIISAKSSAIRVAVMTSEEDRQIARHCRRMMHD